jgi:hypothetical protein
VRKTGLVIAVAAVVSVPSTVEVVRSESVRVAVTGMP